MKFFFLIPLLFIIVSCRPAQSDLPASYSLLEVELVPEGIAYAQSTRKFYLTSIAKSKIIVVDEATGQQEDFIASGAFGFMPGVGILVDKQEDQLHALAGYYPINDSLSSLFTFDLNTRKLTKRFSIPDGGEHFLNDLIQDRSGTIYMTDSKASAVYRLVPGGTRLEKVYQSDEIQYPNGIAISADDSKLYIASFNKGVRVLDLSSNTLINEPDTLGISTGIDGLEFYQGHLYAIQNGVRANGDNFRKLVLNKTQDHIVGMEIIDANNAELNVPLTFCIANNKAVVIANSNIQFLDQRELTFTQPDSLKQTKLLIYEIGN